MSSSAHSVLARERVIGAITMRLGRVRPPSWKLEKSGMITSPTRRWRAILLVRNRHAAYRCYVMGMLSNRIVKSMDAIRAMERRTCRR